MSQSAAQQGLASCHICSLVSKMPAEHDVKCYCPRCGSVLHFRKPNSIMRTWAYLLSACIMYIPANLLPIMATTSMGSTEKDTIMSGILYFWNTGSYGLAALIFVASFTVPLSKLLTLFILLISVRRKSQWRPMQRTKLYRLIEIIGKWSMLDVYVASLMTALVSFGSLMNIRIGYGAVAFGSVVVLTMLAAHSFDPRLIWDPINDMDKKANHD